MIFTAYIYNNITKIYYIIFITFKHFTQVRKHLDLKAIIIRFQYQDFSGWVLQVIG